MRKQILFLALLTAGALIGPGPTPMVAAADGDPVAEARKKWDRDNSWACEQFWKLQKFCNQNGLAFSGNYVLRGVFKFDPDHEETRKYFGYDRKGDHWEWNDAARDNFRSVIDEDDPLGKKFLAARATLEAGIAKRFNGNGKRWAKDSAEAEDPAVKASLSELSKQAFERVLRLQFDDPKVEKERDIAHKALDHPKFEGKYVTPYQLEKMRIRAERKKTGQKYAALAPKTEPIALDGVFKTAGFEGAAAKSEHFAVYCVHGQEVANRLAQQMERGMEYVIDIYGLPDQLRENNPIKTYLEVKDKIQYRRVMDVATDWSEGDKLAYQENTGGTGLPNGSFVDTSADGGADADDNSMNVSSQNAARGARRLAVSAIGRQGTEGDVEDWLWQAIASDCTKHVLNTTLTRWGAFGDYGKGFQASSGVDEWIALARRQVEMDDDVPMERLFRMTIQEHDFKGPQMVKSYAFIHYLFEDDTGEARKFFWHAFAEGTPAAAMRVYGEKLLGAEKVPDEIEDLPSSKDKKLLPPVYDELLRALDRGYRDWILAAF